MELTLILFVLIWMRQNIGSASGIDLIYILQKTSRLINFNNLQQSFIKKKITCILYHFQIISIHLHHVLVFSLFMYCLFSCLHMKNIHRNDVQAINHKKSNVNGHPYFHIKNKLCMPFLAQSA